MVIHHDKSAYGKLKPLKEDLSEKKLAEMLKELNSSENEKFEEDGKKDKEDK